MQPRRRLRTTTAAIGATLILAAGLVLDRAVAAGTEGDTPETTSLDAPQIEGLRWMREEEKLARDVYAALGERWPMRIFEHIGAAEERHMAAVAAVMTRHGVEDPIGDRGPGRFADPRLQDLYDDLVQQGSASRVEALRVGALVEEIDLLDLQAQLQHTTAADVRLVYENLSRGTRNHLRAFSRQVERFTGDAYAPQRLAADAYQEIVTAGMERGRGQGACTLGSDATGCPGCGRGCAEGEGRGRGWGRGRGAGATDATSS